MTKEQFCFLLTVFETALIRHRGNVPKIEAARRNVIAAWEERHAHEPSGDREYFERCEKIVKDAAALARYEDWVRSLPEKYPNIKLAKFEVVKFPDPPYELLGDSGKIYCPMCAGEGMVDPPQPQNRGGSND